LIILECPIAISPVLFAVALAVDETAIVDVSRSPVKAEAKRRIAVVNMAKGLNIIVNLHTI